MIRRYPTQRQELEQSRRVVQGLYSGRDFGGREQVQRGGIWVTRCEEGSHLRKFPSGTAFAVEAIRIRYAKGSERQGEFNFDSQHQTRG